MTKIEVRCTNCGKPKLINQWNIDNNKSGNFFCGNDCRLEHKSIESKKNKVHVRCERCGKDLYLIKAIYNRNKSKKFYCNRDCFSNKKIVKCANCGKDKKIKQYEAIKEKNHFCNKECYDIFQRGCIENPKVECSNCGKLKEVTPYEKEKSEDHFCNKECYDLWQIGKNAGSDNVRFNSIEVKCAWCGETLLLQPNEIHERNYCNVNHRAKWVSENLSGENSPIWRGGFNKNDYSPNFNKLTKKKIKERDNNRCVICGIGSDKQKMAIHHTDYDKANG